MFRFLRAKRSSLVVFIFCILLTVHIVWQANVTNLSPFDGTNQIKTVKAPSERYFEKAGDCDDNHPRINQWVTVANFDKWDQFFQNESLVQGAQNRISDALNRLHKFTNPVTVQGRGIVITIYPSILEKSQVILDYFRNVINCTLPIELWINPSEISENDQLKFKSISNLTIKNLNSNADPNTLFSPSNPQGYDWKIISLINSGFRELLFLDADNLPLRDPEFLFDTLEYQKNGAIFWPDYWRGSNRAPNWKLLNLTCLNELEKEAGQIILDKSRHWKSLQLAMFLMHESSFSFFGDKDTFTTAMRVLNEPYFFYPKELVSVGFMSTEKQTFCGVSMMQMWVDSSPLFLHMNMLKHARKSQVELKLAYFGDPARGISYYHNSDPQVFCFQFEASIQMVNPHVIWPTLFTLQLESVISEYQRDNPKD